MGDSLIEYLSTCSVPAIDSFQLSRELLNEVPTGPSRSYK